MWSSALQKDSISIPPHPLFGEHDCHPIEYLPLSILTYIHVNIYIHVRFINFLFYFELEIGNLTLWLHTKTHYWHVIDLCRLDSG